MDATQAAIDAAEANESGAAAAPVEKKKAHVAAKQEETVEEPSNEVEEE